MSAATFTPEGVRQARVRLGMSLSQLAQALGVDKSTVHRWETGALAPQSPEMLALALTELSRRRPR